MFSTALIPCRQQQQHQQWMATVKVTSNVRYVATQNTVVNNCRRLLVSSCVDSVVRANKANNNSSADGMSLIKATDAVRPQRELQHHSQQQCLLSA